MVISQNQVGKIASLDLASSSYMDSSFVVSTCHRKDIDLRLPLSWDQILEPDTSFADIQGEASFRLHSHKVTFPSFAEVLFLLCRERRSTCLRRDKFYLKEEGVKILKFGKKIAEKRFLPSLKNLH